MVQKIIHTIFIFLFTGLLAFNISCAKKRPHEHGPEPIKNYFDVKSVPSSENPLQGSDKVQIKLHKSALEKEFLLQGQLIRQTQIPMFNNMKSRVVYFKMANHQIIMIEANEGHLVTKDLPQKLLIASFPILSKEKDYVTFDFNKGMTNIFYIDDWRGHEKAPDYKKEFQTAPVKVSYIETAYFSKKNELVIEQEAFSEFEGDNMHFQLKYYLSPYHPNKLFKPTITPKNFDHFGFFEAAPLYQLDGNTVSYATKHNINKTVTYAVSENTPKEYKQAVKDGVLYWNKALGKEVFKAIDAPKNVSAPHPDYNIVQWVNWDQAGFAYADAQMDPRTGEITHAQVFMTSVFAISSKKRARYFLQKIKQDKKALRLQLKGLENLSMCDPFAHINEFEKALESLLIHNASDEQILEVSKDYIREVMAHEVGHTLGLRHNFAASLTANFQEQERDELFKNYVLTGTWPENINPANSVMEYNNFMEATFMGDLIEKATSALDYDTKVTQYLYLDKAPMSWPLYCTDDHVSEFADCNRFDSGANMANYIMVTYKSQLNNLPLKLISTFASLKMKEEALNTFSPKMESYIKNIVELRKELYTLFSDEGKLLQTHRMFDVVSELNSEKVKLQQNSDLQKLLLKGTQSSTLSEALEKVAPTIEEHFHGPYYHGFSDLLDSNNYDRWEDEDGQNIIFTAKDKQIMKSLAHEFFEVLEKQLVKTDIDMISEIKYSDSSISDELIKFLNHKVKTYVFSEVKHHANDESLKYEYEVKGEKLSGTLKNFVRPFDVRIKAAKLLSETKSEVAGFGHIERLVNRNNFEALMNSSFKDNKLPDLNQVELPQFVRRWIIENKKIKDALAN